ncbi:DEAD/DEAH box helicase [Leucothrix mucor]|uniref:DEAD/DEAH box helicase n=1 Tax=Leucothrix mucor TaxID=45248 RepID=UPI0003B6100F|nr:DEAD/DEAH box helicase [Leucothrix mucor]
MYDPETAALLRSAPELPNLIPDNLPQLLTQHYAQIVSIRLGGEDFPEAHEGWGLDKIADAYELIVSVSEDPSIRRPAAFVAASAQLIIARRQKLLDDGSEAPENINRDRLSPELAAVLLFLSSEQYADAHEAASQVSSQKENQDSIGSIITDHIVDLAKGSLSTIISRGSRRHEVVAIPRVPNEETATLAMLNSLAEGIELMAQGILGGLELNNAERSPRSIFEKIKSLSAGLIESETFHRIECSYPGSYHLASLLIAAYDGISESSLTRLPVPNGSDPKFWRKWISFRANKFPYVWPNHRRALDDGFHQNGVSAVMVLPTGAGKTTISSIKIASVLGLGKKVIFLAPTHALVEQLTADLQGMFPQEILGSSVSSDFDLLFQVGAVLPEIEVMTPERCLAMLSFSPSSFEDGGLLVFDECHLLSPESGRIRRSLDSMLCVLAFNKIASSADMLFLSAMVENGKEFASWITHLTGRNCIGIDLLWKPSRQARGLVIYKQESIDTIKDRAIEVQTRLNQEAGSIANNLRAAAKRELLITPYAIWGLQHNWLDQANKRATCSYTKLIDGLVNLGGGLSRYGVAVQPNVNYVSSKIAELSARNSLKTIVFVNQKSHAISTSKNISNALEIKIEPTSDELFMWEALELELGGLKHSLLTKGNAAVPHNASMLRLERDLSERMYKRDGGAMVIVATPTLAQGLNLPAQLAILAGDKRAEVESGGRESLAAHELLNAAARAGRAGHLANGIVLLVPEPVLSFPENKQLSPDVVQKLQALIPEDDRCVEISDPLGVILDRISEGNTIDNDVIYMVNRLATLEDTESDGKVLFNLSRSFAAYRLRESGQEEKLNNQLAELVRLVAAEANDDIDQSLLILASQSGLPPIVLLRLKQKIEQDVGSLPCSIPDWIEWLINWLILDLDARNLLLADVRPSILGAIGERKDGEITDDVLRRLLPGINSWILGMPLRDVELALGGVPDSSNQTVKSCPRVRELVGAVLPRGLTFIIGLVTRVVTEVDPYDTQENLLPDVVDSLSMAIRLGYDTPEKLKYSISNPSILSRVAVHQAYFQEIN